MCTTSHATLFVHCVEPSTLVCVVFVDSLAIPTSPNIVNVFVSCQITGQLNYQATGLPRLLDYLGLPDYWTTRLLDYLTTRLLDYLDYRTTRPLVYWTTGLPGLPDYWTTGLPEYWTT